MLSIDKSQLVCCSRPSLLLPLSFRVVRTWLQVSVLAIASAVLIPLCTAARANVPNAPTATALQARLSMKLPAYWNVTKLTIEATANYGNAVEPEFKQRLVASIEPTDDLYLSVGKLGNIDLLARSMKSGEKRKLYLIATSTLRADTWQTVFKQQNQPTASAGKPRSFFTGATIVRGSPEDAIYQKQQAAEAAARQQKQLAAIARKEAIAAAEAKGLVEKAEQVAVLRAAKTKAAKQEAARRHAAFEASLKTIKVNARNLLRADLPTYWQIKALTLTPPADVTAQDTLAPQAVVRQRFAATLVLTHDTFVAAKTGKITLLRPALNAGIERRLEGAVESVKGPEGWRSKLAMGTPAAAADGQPRSYYPATAIVQGSPEEAAYQKQQAREAAARQQKQLVAIAHKQAIAAARAKGLVEEAEQAATLRAAKAKAAKQDASRRHAAFEASLKAIKANAGNLLRADLPTYWQIKALTLTPPADVTEQGALTPQAVVRQRLTATVVLTQDTFSARKTGTVTILQPVLKTGAKRELEGTLQSLQAPEGWRSKLHISNPISTADGQPQAHYSDNALVAGSPAAMAYLKRHAAILRAGEIPAGTYKARSPYPTTCDVTDMDRSDGRILSFISCGGVSNMHWNAVFVSGPGNRENPFFSRVHKAGLGNHMKNFTWGNIANGGFYNCRDAREFGAGVLIGARLSGRLLLLSPVYEGRFQCTAAFSRTSDARTSTKSR